MICSRCRENKLADQFHKNDRYCKVCRREYQRLMERKGSRYTKRYELYRDKILARNAVWLAVRNGALNKKPCSQCGQERVVAHHLNGYDQENRLKVEWLCTKHHSEVHA